MVTMMENAGRIVVLLVCAASFSEESAIKIHRRKPYEYRAFDPNTPTCKGEYANMTHHSMCRTDDPRVTKKGVSAQDRQLIVDMHNDIRRNVQPPATDLSPLMWNDKIAEVAQKIAQLCPDDHDRGRWVPSLGMSVGQNLGFGADDWPMMLKGWHSEVKGYVFGKKLTRDEDWEFGHYTHMVSNMSFYIGCGYASCRNSRFGKYYVCNYGAGQISISNPYTPGKRCGACPNNCKNGLCDCKGLVCLNGGTLNLDTCTCQCMANYKGKDCSQLNCDVNEPARCSGKTVRVCSFWYYYRLCPFSCGRCAPRKVFTTAHGCRYTGKRFSAEQCKTFKRQGRDSNACQSKYGRWGCKACTWYTNVAREYCPVQCGLCDPPKS